MSTSSHIARGDAAELRGDLLTAASEFEAASQESTPAIAAEGWLGRARLAWRQSRFAEAQAAIDRARALAVEAGDDELRARVENGAGAVHYAQGAYAQAEGFYRVARGLTRYDLLRAKIDLNLGVIANIEGDFPRARTLYENARGAFRSIGDSGNEALALHNLGMLFADEERWDEADEAYRDSLVLLEQQGNRAMVGSVMLNRAEVQSARGQPNEAMASCDVALTIFTDFGDEVGRGEALRWRARALRPLQQSDSAVRDLTEAIRLARRLHAPLLEAEATEDLARVLVDRGDVAAARDRFHHALELFEQLRANREVQRVTRDLRALAASSENTWPSRSPEDDVGGDEPREGA